jgi:hypothetical protein
MNVDGYKSCWGVRLQHVEYESDLHIYDYKGSASFQFKGSDEASNEALKLLSWLESNNVPLAYDGTLGGTVA